MSTKLMRRNAAVVAVFALCCVFGAKAQTVVVVATPVELSTALATWTNGDLELKLAVGVDYDIQATDLGSAAVLVGMPGNLTIEPASGVPDSEPSERISLNLGFSLDPNGHNVIISRMKFAGAISALNQPASIVSLDRVWLDGNLGVVGIRTRADCSLTMSGCAVTGGNVQINCGGAATISRCSFMEGIFNFSSTAQAVEFFGNRFEAEPVITATATGRMNFFRSGTTFEAAGGAVFALGVDEVTGGGPRPAETSGAPSWKLKYALQPFPLLSVPAIPVGPSFDIEGNPVDLSQRNIGADEVITPFVDIDWSKCTITGPTGATVYSDKSPILGGGVPFTLEVEFSGTELNVNSDVTARIYSQFTLLHPSEGPAFFPVELDVTFDSGRSVLVGRAEGVRLPNLVIDRGALLAPLRPWDGVAEVRLVVVGINDEVSALTNEVTASDTSSRRIIIDSKPPALPTQINAASILTGADKTCGGWSFGTGTFVGSKPHFFFTSLPSLNVDFQIDLVDNADPWSDTQAGAVGSGFAQLPSDDAQVDAIQDNDVIFTTGGGTTTDPPVSKIGTAIWTNADAFAGSSVQVLTKSASQGTGDVSWTLQFAPNLVPNVVKWDARITITDRAGNSTEIDEELCPRFWWMPPGSTFASVGDDTDALNPQFSWSLGMTEGSNASTLDLPTEAPCITEAQFLTCFATIAATPLVSGWDPGVNTGDIGWTPLTAVKSVDSNTRMGNAGQFTLGELFAKNLGEAAVVMVRVVDPAGNPQEILGMPGTLTATTSTVGDLADDLDDVAGIYLIPNRVAEGALDTIASARFFLNRTDRSDESRLWSIDPDETTFGVGPNVPLTPIDACGQRLEAEITVDVSVPDNLPGEVDASQVDVEFEVYEEGRFVAAGTLSRRGNDPSAPMKLFIPADLLEGRGNPTTAAGNSRSDPATGVLVEQESADFPDPAAFLNFPPPPCESSSNLHISNNPDQYGDRLGDDGDPASRDLITGDVVKPYRTRAVAYTVVLRARSGTLASGTTDAARFDTTPATIHFYVKPDTTTDSGVPPIKSNKKL